MAGEVSVERSPCRYWRGLPAMLGALASLAGGQPLGYLLTWRYLPGRWIAFFPESFAVALCCVVVGFAASVAATFLAATRLRHQAEGAPGNSLGAFATLIMAGTGFGCGLYWLLFVASCRAG